VDNLNACFHNFIENEFVEFDPSYNIRWIFLIVGLEQQFTLPAAYVVTHDLSFDQFLRYGNGKFFFQNFFNRWRQDTNALIVMKIEILAFKQDNPQPDSFFDRQLS